MRMNIYRCALEWHRAVASRQQQERETNGRRYHVTLNSAARRDVTACNYSRLDIYGVKFSGRQYVQIRVDRDTMLQ